MKLLLTLLFLTGISTSSAFACVNGDTSKVLLVIGEDDGGQEEKVVGEINSQSGKVSLTTWTYMLTSQSPDQVELESDLGGKYVFSRKDKPTFGHFCFAAIYGTRVSDSSN